MRKRKILILTFMLGLFLFFYEFSFAEIRIFFSPKGEIAEEITEQIDNVPNEPFATSDGLPDGEWVYETDFVEVERTSDWFFWGIVDFEGFLYMGTYEMYAPKIYKYPPWQLIKTFTGGESVLRLREFNSVLYAASEDMGYAGQLYRRDSDAVWTVVHQETAWYPKPFIVFKNYLYAAWANNSDQIKIMRSSDGVTWQQVQLWNNLSATRFGIFQDELYIFGSFQPSRESWVAKTSDGVNWHEVTILCHHHYAAPWHVGIEFREKLYLGQDGGTSVYRYNGETYYKVLQIENVHGTQSSFVFGDYLYFFFGQSWKSTSGNSYLYRTKTGDLGDWELFQIFHDAQNARAIWGAAFDNRLYVGAENILYGLIFKDDLWTI